MDTTSSRCPICLNSRWHARGDTDDCTHCGLVLVHGVGPDGIRDEIAAMLASGCITDDPARRWRLPGGALRNAAWALHHTLDGDRAAAAQPIPHHVTLGIIARHTDLDDIVALAGDFRHVVVLLDADAPQLAGLRPDARVVVHPLDGDFAAQRNRVQALAPTPWVLQLDTDERPTPRLLASLGWLTRAADQDGLRSLGLARRNLVDGVLSSLYPDIQYRLNRGDVRFEGAVHERPSAPFPQTSLALTGDIEHRLGSDRVRARSVAYEAMRPGAGRPTDERALLRPFASP